MVMGGSPVFDAVTDGVDEEKSVVLGEFSLVELIFMTFLFPGCSGCCDVAASIVRLVWDFVGVLDDDVGVLEGVCGKKSCF